MQASEARTETELKHYEDKFETFKQEQRVRTNAVGRRADELLDLVERSLKNHLEAGGILQLRELPSVMAAACKSLGGCHANGGDRSWSGSVLG